MPASKYPVLTLKPDRDFSVRNGHPWIFSGGIKKCSADAKTGDLVRVESATGQFLALAHYNSRTSIAARVLSYNEIGHDELFAEKIASASKLRSRLFSSELTNAYRVINAEGDMLSGLIVDRYADVIIIQITTAGMDLARDLIVDLLKKEFAPRTIFERSVSAARSEEGLAPVNKLLWGEPLSEVTIRENGLQFMVSSEVSQKTGFFLDQREMRNFVRLHSNELEVLNCFSFTGGFSVAAAVGGAKKVVSVDVSAPAVDLARKNVELNCTLSSGCAHEFLSVDAFDYLRKLEVGAFDMIILDPPAFAKHRGAVKDAERGYREINHSAARALKKGGILVTSSCSYFLDSENFEKCVARGIREAGREASIISRHISALDHPRNLFHPEGEYLKSLILAVS